VTAEAILTLRAALRRRVDASTVAWSTLRGLDAAAIAAQEIWIEGEGPAALGDLFEVSGGPAARLRLVGDLALMDGIGAGLSVGELVVDGDAGWYLGRRMSGGAIEVRGSAGPHAGGADPGAKRGMTGGEIIIRGFAGPMLGAGLRRGLIAVQHDAGEDAGRAMLAGSILVFGSLGTNPGLFSKRGSIVAFGAHSPPPGYRYACTYRPPHLRVTLGYLKSRYQVPVTPRQLAGAYRRYSGDLAELGAGEILSWIP
jgi:formylmethanofuran dehydrogenase subunit C